MLLRQNVESNPGMNNNKQGTFSIISYNCNGLREKNKLRRLTRKITPIIKKGGIVLLQETHLPDTNYLKNIWKEKFESNCIKSNSAGVLTFFNNEYETVEVEKDSEGRFLILVLKNQDKKFIVANSYFPNDHRIAIDFAETVYLKILEMQHKYPEYLTIAGGDYNVCMNPNDSLNRNRTNVEKNLSNTIASNNKITNLIDSYRSMHKSGGYTWNRGTCYSRLDYIFISNTLIGSLVKSEQDWSYESSDHAAVKILLNERSKIVKGPGIIKVNSKILDDPKIVKQIENDGSDG
jgi:exonuclease III